MRIVPIITVLVAGALASCSAVSADSISSSVTKVFTIEKRDNLGAFMCPVGLRLLSATVATQRGQSFTLAYLDEQQKEVATNKWVSVAGFRLTRRPDQVLDAVMVCGG